MVLKQGFCMTSFVQKGAALLGVLMLLTSTLFLLLLYDDQGIGFYRQLVFQHQQQQKQHLYLQQQAQEKSKNACISLDPFLPTDSHLLIFKAADTPQSIRQYRWCVREKLFKQIPRKNALIGQFSDYIDQQKFSLFAPHFDRLDPQGTLYWFSQSQAHWQIQQDVYGVIIAQGDLTITGQGRIRGAIITQGELHLDPQISLTYHKNTVAYLTQKFSRWQMAEQSWYDFTPIE